MQGAKLRADNEMVCERTATPVPPLRQAEGSASRPCLPVGSRNAGWWAECGLAREGSTTSRRREIPRKLGMTRTEAQLALD